MFCPLPEHAFFRNQCSNLGLCECSNHLVLCMDEDIRRGVLESVPLPYRQAYEEKVPL